MRTRAPQWGACEVASSTAGRSLAGAAADTQLGASLMTLTKDEQARFDETIEGMQGK
jgi:hypothetical protein